MDPKDLSNNDFMLLLRRQANAVYVACEKPVADDLAASLLEAAARIEKLQRQRALEGP